MNPLAFVGWYMLSLPELRLEPTVETTSVFVSSAHVTAGGVGGAVGVQMIVADQWLAELQAGPVFMLGNALMTRVGGGAQLQVSDWTPAAWLRFTALWGARIEVLEPSGKRPARPVCSVALALSPLRFTGRRATLSLLEPAVGVGLSGGFALELTFMQLGAHF